MTILQKTKSVVFEEYAEETYKQLTELMPEVKVLSKSSEDVIVPNDFTQLKLHELGVLSSKFRSMSVNLKNRLTRINCYLELYQEHSEALEASLIKSMQKDNPKSTITEIRKTLRTDEKYKGHMEDLAELKSTKRFLEGRIDVAEDVIQSLSREQTRRVDKYV